jgi:D-apionolactonase
MNATVGRKAIHYEGEAQRLAKIPLRAGPWSMDFQDGDLRRIALDHTEVVQRLCVLVRGKNWETLPRTIASLDVEINVQSFLLSCECQSHLEDLDFRWTLRAEGSEDGTIRYAFDGTAFSTFWASRIGICVLQSTTEFCGRTLSVTAENGTIQQLVLPQEIAPWPLFTDAREISYRLDEFPPIQLSLSGDLFEAEDQRNWSDASFKIYSRPLRLPNPYRVDEGSRIQQSACLSLASHVRPHSNTPESNVFRISGLRGSHLPKIGLGFSYLPEAILDRLGLLRALHPEYLSIEHDFMDPRREIRISDASALAKALKIPLEIRTIYRDGSWLKDRSLLEQSLGGAAVCRWLIDADSKFDPLTPALPVGAEVYWGSSKGFVEINRNRSIARQGHGVWFSIDPRVHASDNDSLVESLSAQASLATDARRLAQGSPLAVSCLSSVCPGDEGFRAGTLQMSLFEAAWTLASFKHLAEGETDSVAYFTDVGLCGLMPVHNRTGYIDSSGLACGAISPIYHVLSDLIEFRGGESLFTRSSHPLRVEGIAVRAGERIRVLLTNFDNDEQAVTVQAEAVCQWLHTRCLDESNCLEAVTEPARWRALPLRPLMTAGGAADVVIPPRGIVTLEGRSQEKG